ncbi:MAG: cysteine desulfurase NifS [Acidobacteria bacterium]|nr:cysteine desulfurase NifS [Acidobacteriota bacterium]
MKAERVYMDNSATTQLDEAVLHAMLPYFSQEFGNASSIHQFGQKARAAVEEARAKVAALIRAEASEVVFTSGGTESDNTALRGVAEFHRFRGNHIVTSKIEHHAVLNTCEALEKDGFSVTYLPVSEEGLVDPEAVREAVTEKTVFVSIMHANNEIGTLQPIRELARIAHARGALFHTDAVQSVGKIPMDVKEHEVDLLSLSAHKIHGPKGAGILYVRKGTKMRPLLYGGGHERNRRAGTENVPGIVGLGKACEIARERLPEFQRRVGALRDRLEQGILDRIKQVYVNGSRDHRLPHISNLSFEFAEGEGLLISLDLKGVAVSTGSACSSGSLEPSHVLTAIGRSAYGTLRFSLGWFNTDRDVDYLLEVLPPIVDRLRQMSPQFRKREAILSH